MSIAVLPQAGQHARCLALSLIVIATAQLMLVLARQLWRGGLPAVIVRMTPEFATDWWASQISAAAGRHARKRRLKSFGVRPTIRMNTFRNALGSP